MITDLNEVSKKDFDMACVVIRSTAVGGKGTEIAGALLEKGIHVIQEHPVHYKFNTYISGKLFKSGFFSIDELLR